MSVRHIGIRFEILSWTWKSKWTEAGLANRQRTTYNSDMEPADPKGIKILPNPVARQMNGKRGVLVVTECYCPNGHSLMHPRASFNGHPGILLKVQGEKGAGHVVLSPVYGEKSRIALEVDLTEGEKLEVSCPFCETVFPMMGPCPCGAELVALNTTPVPDDDNCLGICNRVGCIHSEVRSRGDLILLSMFSDLKDG